MIWLGSHSRLFRWRRLGPFHPSHVDRGLLAEANQRVVQGLDDVFAVVRVVAGILGGILEVVRRLQEARSPGGVSIGLIRVDYSVSVGIEEEVRIASAIVCEDVYKRQN